MNTPTRKEISDALREAIEKENLHTRGAAVCLNINPCYVSMCMNEKSWDSMGKASWERITEWYLTHSPLIEFNIPEGEEIWKKEEKAESGERRAESRKKEKTIIPEVEKPVEKVVNNHLVTKEEVKIKVDEIIKEYKAKTAKKVDKKHKEKPAKNARKIDERLVEEFSEHLGKTNTEPELKTGTLAPEYTDAVRLKVALDIEINLLVNGQRVSVK